MRLEKSLSASSHFYAFRWRLDEVLNGAFDAFDIQCMTNLNSVEFSTLLVDRLGSMVVDVDTVLDNMLVVGVGSIPVVVCHNNLVVGVC